MLGSFSALMRRFKRSKGGTAAIEFALLLPILMTMTFGIMEVSLCMASLVTLEGGLKEASRYGITSQTTAFDPALLSKVPNAFKQAGMGDREAQIGYILAQHTLSLIDLNSPDTKITAQIFSSFNLVKYGEPYTDLNGNGQYDGPPANGGLGEPFSDIACPHNGVWDGPTAPSTGLSMGNAGDIVVLTVSYNWKILTPFVGPLLGQLKSGQYVIPMSSSIVVKNEPAVAGSTLAC